jgi:hypothetical protein
MDSDGRGGREEGERERERERDERREEEENRSNSVKRGGVNISARESGRSSRENIKRKQDKRTEQRGSL